MIHFDNIYVRLAKNTLDLDQVFAIRFKGYRKFFRTPDLAKDDLDLKSNVEYLLATNEKNQAVGTMRLVNGTSGPIELEKFVSLKKLFNFEKDLSVLEASRFSIPSNSNSISIKFLLFKAMYEYCIKNNIKKVVTWVRPSARRAYRILPFKEIGGGMGKFTHPSLGGMEHVTICMDLEEARNYYLNNNSSMFEFFCKKQFQNININ